jgi:hypothetical protein
MGIYSEGAAEHLEGVGRAMARASDPHHKAILANYQHHLALEQGGRYQEIFSRGLIVPDPRYKIGWGGEENVYEGAEAVKGWYHSLKDAVAFLRNEQIAVADWGFSSWSDLIEFVPGDEMGARGLEVDDPSKTYMLRSNQAMFWMYNDDAILRGEIIYVVNNPTVELAEPNDTLTKAMMIEQCEPYFEGAKLPA